MRKTLFFVHSPLVGPGSWTVVASELRSRQWRAAVAELEDDGDGEWWRRHVRSAARALPEDREGVVPVLHSGAGPLAGPLVSELGDAIAGVVFVDAGLPGPAGSRLDLLRREMGDAFANQFLHHLEAGGRYPEWTDQALLGPVGDDAVRRQIVAMQRPRRLDFWLEELPEAPSRSGLPCGYLQLSRAYAVPAAEARLLGWPVIERDGGHFDLMTKPAEVADDIERLLGAMGLEAG